MLVAREEVQKVAYGPPAPKIFHWPTVSALEGVLLAISNIALSVQLNYNSN